MKKGLKKIIREGLLNEPRENPNKEKDIIILIIGTIFFVILFVVFNINKSNMKNITNKDNNNNNNEKEVVKKEEISLNDLFDKYKDNYNYDITINNNEKYIYYKGSISNNINNGTKTIDTKTIEYEITNNGAIDVNTKHEINDLYDGYLYYFFNPINVYNFVKEIDSYQKSEDNIFKYDTIYNNENIKFTINSIDDKLNINYLYKDIVYNIVIN